MAEKSVGIPLEKDQHHECRIVKRAGVQDYDRVCASIVRWRRRLTRALNALNKLEAQKRRIERKLGLLEASAGPQVGIEAFRASALLCDLEKRAREAAS